VFIAIDVRRADVRALVNQLITSDHVMSPVNPPDTEQKQRRRGEEGAPESIRGSGTSTSLMSRTWKQGHPRTATRVGTLLDGYSRSWQSLRVASGGLARRQGVGYLGCLPALGGVMVGNGVMLGSGVSPGLGVAEEDGRGVMSFLFHPRFGTKSKQTRGQELPFHSVCRRHR
jgi:hypothetical protein